MTTSEQLGTVREGSVRQSTERKSTVFLVATGATHCREVALVATDTLGYVLWLCDAI